MYPSSLMGKREDHTVLTVTNFDSYVNWIDARVNSTKMQFIV